MSTHKSFDKICCVVLAFVIVVSVLFVNGEKLGIKISSKALGYEDKLFDNSIVHTMDIVTDDWDSFLETCTDEEYINCSVVIDNDAFKNVALRAKGNTSLTNVKNYGNNRYSLKIEFDKYDSANTYYGLDKLCLNNIIQDNTYMKDYLAYTMMGEFGVASPLCSFVYITVNGEDWGLYLAVEGVEDSFLQRNYGNDYGELYKPDSMQMGGGRGNGEGFDMKDFKDKFGSFRDDTTSQAAQNKKNDNNNGEIKPVAFQPMENSGQQGGGMQPPGGFGRMSGLPQMPDGEMPQMPDGEMPQMPDGEMPQMPDGEMPKQFAENEEESEEKDETPNQNKESDKSFENGFQFSQSGMNNNGGFGGGMGSDDVKLIYSDDNISSYSNIFDNAKTKVSDSDKNRLIKSLKNINQNTDLEDSVDIESVIRYFVVHNFVLNFDSYTGSMIHNYYLYESEGQLSMIPWDYNLAFGGFMSMGGAESLVNYPIDSPVSGGDTDSRPMLAWIFNNEEYTQQYHELFNEFISEFFDSGKFEAEINRVKEMISPYVEKDPTKFCAYEEFEKGVETLKSFCTLRAESISKQLDGAIGSTSETQTDKTAFVKADEITISDMGSMDGMGGGTRENTKMPEDNQNSETESTMPEIPGGDRPEMPGGEAPQMPDGKPEGKNGENFEMPDGVSPGRQNKNITETLIVSAVSLAVLIAGILFAFFYRRRKLKL